MTVNHGVPGSSPGGGANRKVIRNGDFFSLKSIKYIEFIVYKMVILS